MSTSPPRNLLRKHRSKKLQSLLLARYVEVLSQGTPVCPVLPLNEGNVKSSFDRLRDLYLEKRFKQMNTR